MGRHSREGIDKSVEGLEISGFRINLKNKNLKDDVFSLLLLLARSVHVLSSPNIVKLST